MKLNYDAETDSLYIELKEGPSVDSKEIADGMVVDLDEEGNIVGIDIEHASTKIDLNTLDASSFPAISKR